MHKSSYDRFIAVGRVPCLLIAFTALIFYPVTTFGGRPSKPSDSAMSGFQGPGAVNHPIGMRPSSAVRIPAGWPLAQDGTLSCLTCHTTLGGDLSRGNHQLRSAHDPKSPQTFCGACHGESSGRTVEALHWLAIGRAHTFADDEERSSEHGFNATGSDAMCMSCHDGVTARDAHYHSSRDQSNGYVGDRSRNHPVGVRYPRSGTRRVDVPLRPMALLPKSIQLPSGKVSCLSCHNLYSSEPMRLSVPIEGSRLCMTCHQMD